MPESLRESAPPVEIFDVALLDLDGVVYVGDHAVPHAVHSLMQCRAKGIALAYVTNNASRPPAAVAEHLRALGLPALEGDVVTSSQAGARVMSRLVPAGTAVFAVGGPGVDAALAERGLRPVRSLADSPQAVMQGFGKDVGWAQLADAACLLHRGVPWVATNMDLTIPTPFGLAPGNGAFVGMLVTATGRRPDVVAGKPERPLVQESILRTGAQRPLMIGDRLDTDIEAATRSAIPSLLVLTGVTQAADLLAAPPALRPDLLSADLRGLLIAHPGVQTSVAESVCRESVARNVAGTLVLEGPADTLEAVEDLWRAAAALSWAETMETSAAVERMQSTLRALL